MLAFQGVFRNDQKLPKAIVLDICNSGKEGSAQLLPPCFFRKIKVCSHSQENSETKKNCQKQLCWVFAIRVKRNQRSYSRECSHSNELSETIKNCQRQLCWVFAIRVRREKRSYSLLFISGRSGNARIVGLESLSQLREPQPTFYYIHCPRELAGSILLGLESLSQRSIISIAQENSRAAMNLFIRKHTYIF